MPIRGFRRQDIGEPRWKTLGKLKKGAPKNEGLSDLEYFRFDSENAQAVATFAELYGDEPDRFEKVYFPFNEMERVFSCWRELYGQSGLCKLRCDGADIVDWIEGGQHYHGRKPCDYQGGRFLDTENKCPGCPVKPIGRLTVIFPELWKAGYAGYFVTLETHSWNDIATIVGVLTTYEPLTNRPFTLWREDTRIGVPIKDRRAVVEKSLVKLTLQDEWLMLEWTKAQEQAQAQLAAPQGPDWDAYGNLDDEPVDVTPVEDVPLKPRPLAASDEQKTAIAAAIKALGANDVDLQLKNKGYPALDVLSEEQATELLARLAKAQKPPEKTDWLFGSEKLHKAMWVKAGQLGLDKEQVHKALGVERVADWCARFGDDQVEAFRVAAEVKLPVYAKLQERETVEGEWIEEEDEEPF